MRAEVVAAFFAAVASAAGYAGFQGHMVACFDGGYGRSDGFDDAGGFVAEDLVVSEPSSSRCA